MLSGCNALASHQVTLHEHISLTDSQGGKIRAPGQMAYFIMASTDESGFRRGRFSKNCTLHVKFGTVHPTFGLNIGFCHVPFFHSKEFLNFALDATNFCCCTSNPSAFITYEQVTFNVRSYSHLVNQLRLALSQRHGTGKSTAWNGVI
jgi:hypothetical protein